MHYVVSYVTPFGDQVFNFLNEEEFGLLMVPCTVLFKSENFNEAEFYYNELTK